MRALADRIVHARAFEYILVVLIVGAAIMKGIEVSGNPLEPYELWVGLFALLFLVALVLEVLLKMFALFPRVDRYFHDGWNVFDFLVISFFIVSLEVDPDVADYGLLIILARLLRLLQGLAIVQDLRLILSTMIRSLPSAAHIMILMGIVLYVYAIVGQENFGEYDPERWGNLAVSALSLFEIVTLEGWVDVMRPLVKAEPWAWLYFVSFVIISAYLVTNVFVAVVIRNLEQSMQERQQASAAPASKEEILRELRSTQQSLRRLEERLQQLPD